MECINIRHFDLSSQMRMLWQQHVYWTRLLMISLLDDLKDQDATQERLLRNPIDFQEVFGQFYDENAARMICELLTEHLIIGAKLIVAVKDNHLNQAKELNDKWYENAACMACAFASINPYYHEEELKEMLDRHLELTTNELNLRIKKDFEKDVQNFDVLEQEAMMMADYFVCGIVCQFHPLLSCCM